MHWAARKGLLNSDLLAALSRFENLDVNALSTKEKRTALEIMLTTGWLVPPTLIRSMAKHGFNMSKRGAW